MTAHLVLGSGCGFDSAASTILIPAFLISLSSKSSLPLRQKTLYSFVRSFGRMIDMASRELSGAENAEARRVFGVSISLGRVEISDSLGLGDRPWTSVGLWKYTLNLGPNGFRDAVRSQGARELLIHELTHVWQGQNSTIGFGYMLSSIGAQCKSFVTTGGFDAAYAVVPGKSWDDYNCEQQATIVEQWYGNGLSTTDPLYPFIRDHIRPGKN